MNGLNDEADRVPVEGTVAFALVTARVGVGQALSLAAAGVAAQRQLLSRAAALVLAPPARRVGYQGDGLVLLFAHPHEALSWAQGSQALCPAEPGRPEAALALRIGIHLGPVRCDGQALFGPGVHLAARIAAVAGPGETLLSAAAQAQTNPTWRELMEDLGPYYLQHFDEPQQLFKLGAPSCGGLGEAVAAERSAAPS